MWLAQIWFLRRFGSPLILNGTAELRLDLGDHGVRLAIVGLVQLIEQRELPSFSKVAFEGQGKKAAFMVCSRILARVLLTVGR